MRDGAADPREGRPVRRISGRMEVEGGGATCTRWEGEVGGTTCIMGGGIVQGKAPRAPVGRHRTVEGEGTTCTRGEALY